jgi:hypothetical protein
MNMVIHDTDEAVDIALMARKAMQHLRDSSLPGQPFYMACELSIMSIDQVVVEARRLRDVRTP